MFLRWPVERLEKLKHLATRAIQLEEEKRDTEHKIKYLSFSFVFANADYRYCGNHVAKSSFRGLEARKAVGRETGQRGPGQDFASPKWFLSFQKHDVFFQKAVANVNDKDSRCQNVELWTFFQVCNSSVFKLRRLAVYNVYTSISGAKFQRSTFKSKKEFAYRMCTLSYVYLNYSTLSYSALWCFSLNYSSLSYSLLEWNCWVRAICIVNIFSNASAYIGPLFAHRSCCSPMSEDQFDSFLLATNINGLLHILMAFGSSWLRFAFARPLSPELQVIIWYIPSKQCRYEQGHFINFNAMVDQSHGAHICIYTHHHKPRYSLR